LELNGSGEVDFGANGNRKRLGNDIATNMVSRAGNTVGDKETLTASV
jgi:hypothetical protein